MRTGPFSSTKVIDRLNACFVPVYAVNDDYRAKGVVPQREQAEYLRIYREALAKKFSAGTVHVYVLNPKGEVIGTRHVADAAKTNELIAFLDELVAKLGTKAGKPLVEPKAQSVPPEHPKGSLVLHLAARGLGGGGSWDGTAENWVVYTPDEVKKLLPAGPVDAGITWGLDPKLAARLLVHVYPVTENNDPAKNQIRKQALRGKVIAVKGGVAVARLDGRLVMRHDFYHKPDGNVVETRLLGHIEFEPATGKVRSLRLVTDGATYGGGKFGVALRSE
ncbi:MAG TPA: hypothetical protein VG013_41855 [Gemmataceae bacterium]|jgi:hypothetical protein|nr:hypothetical protein [Gemmataceae bacterium]